MRTVVAGRALLSFLLLVPFGARAENDSFWPGPYQENLFRLAISHFERAVNACGTTSKVFCGLSGTQRATLKSLFTVGREFAEGTATIAFASESENTLLFPPGENKAFAVETGPSKRIIFNRDRIILPTGTGRAFPINSSDAFERYVSALALGWGGVDERQAILMGSTVSGVLSDRIKVSATGDWWDAVPISDPLARPQILILDPDGAKDAPRSTSVFLQDADGMRSLNGALREILKCADGPIETFVLGAGSGSSKSSLRGNMLEIPIVLQGKRTCVSDPALLEEFDVTASVRLDAVRADGSAGGSGTIYRFVPGSVTKKAEWGGR